MEEKDRIAEGMSSKATRMKRSVGHSLVAMAYHTECAVAKWRAVGGDWKIVQKCTCWTVTRPFLRGVYAEKCRCMHTCSVDETAALLDTVSGCQQPRCRHAEVAGYGSLAGPRWNTAVPLAHDRFCGKLTAWHRAPLFHTVQHRLRHPARV